MKPLHYIAAFSVALNVNVARSAEPSWIADSVSGCKVWNPNPQPNETIKWSGDCRDGKANGFGTLEWFQSGRKSDIDEFTGANGNGAIMQDGRHAADIDFSKIVFTMLKEYDNRRLIRVDVPRNIELGYAHVEVAIIDRALRIVNQVAPNGHPNSTFARVYIHYMGANGAPIQNNYWADTVIEVDNRNHERFVGDNGYQNSARTFRLNRVHELILAEENNRRKQQEQAALIERNARQTAERKTAEGLIEDFTKRYAIEKMVSTKDLKANPFVFEGKVIAVVLTFNQMQTATQALFDEEVVVSDIPKGYFTQRTCLLLAGVGKGTTPVRTPFGGEMNLPVLKFLGIVPNFPEVQRALRPHD
jgi:hypothetical protein